MTVLFPTSIDEAVATLADPAVQVLAGGTDFMVEVNGGRRRPEQVLSLRRIPELRTWQRRGPTEVRLGAAVTYTDLLEPDLAALFPALAQAARTVGSPPIRNAGTIGGNLATASPAGRHPAGAVGARGDRRGGRPRRGCETWRSPTSSPAPSATPSRPGELIVAVRVPVLSGHQEFRKIGVRNAMVIAVASLALALDSTTRTVRCALGSVGPGPVRAREAEAWLAGGHRLGPRRRWRSRAPPTLDVGDASAALGGRRPLARSTTTAAPPTYRRHAVGVLARRAAAQALASMGFDPAGPAAAPAAGPR